MRTLFAAIFLAFPLVASAIPMYAMVDLGGGGGSRSYGINDAGVVVGMVGDRAAVFVNGQASILTELGAAPSRALAINDRGQIVGIVSTGRFSHAFLYNNGETTMIGTSYLRSSAVGINNAGQVAVSTSTTPVTFGGAAWLYEHGELTRLEEGEATVSAINDHGVAVGNYHYMYGTVWKDGQVERIPALEGGRFALAKDINNAGHVVGQSETATSSRPFFYSDSIIRDLGTLGGDWGYATALNDLDQVIGRSNTADGTEEEFFWDKGVMSKIDDLLLDAAGWFITDVSDINDRQQIAATACKDGICKAVRLDPVHGVPLPGSLSLLAVGLFGIAVNGLKRRKVV